MIQWHRILPKDGALGREEPATVILEARGVPIGYCTRQVMEAIVRTCGRLCSLISAGLVSRDLDVVVLEVEMLGGFQQPPEVSL